MSLSFQVEGMINGILGTVEFEAFLSEALTEFEVEGRGGLDPLLIEQDAGITMPHENIRLHQPRKAHRVRTGSSPDSGWSKRALPHPRAFPEMARVPMGSDRQAGFRLHSVLQTLPEPGPHEWEASSG